MDVSNVKKIGASKDARLSEQVHDLKEHLHWINSTLGSVRDTLFGEVSLAPKMDCCAVSVKPSTSVQDLLRGCHELVMDIKNLTEVIVDQC